MTSLHIRHSKEWIGKSQFSQSLKSLIVLTVAAQMAALVHCYQLGHHWNKIYTRRQRSLIELVKSASVRANYIDANTETCCIQEFTNLTSYGGDNDMSGTILNFLYWCAISQCLHANWVTGNYCHLSYELKTLKICRNITKVKSNKPVHRKSILGCSFSPTVCRYVDISRSGSARVSQYSESDVFKTILHNKYKLKT